jgi:hypothetical protein
MSALNMQMELCRVFYCAAQFEKRHSLPLPASPLFIRKTSEKYANGTVPCRTVPNRRHSLQLVDLIDFSELCNCTPLTRETECRTVRQFHSLSSEEIAEKKPRFFSGTGVSK